MKKFVIAALAATALISTSAIAAVTFDSFTGVGFVGKGDVQLVYGWNNNALQRQASGVDFRVNSLTVTEVSWECTNANNDKIQERERTTTTSLQGLVTTIARENSKGKDGAITGFNLSGYEGSGVTTSTATEGPQTNSCPASPSTWYLSTPAGDPEVISQEGGGLEVTSGGGIWTPIG